MMVAQAGRSGRVQRERVELLTCFRGGSSSRDKCIQRRDYFILDVAYDSE